MRPVERMQVQAAPRGRMGRMAVLVLAWVVLGVLPSRAVTEYGCAVAPTGSAVKLSAYYTAPAATNKVLVVVCACSNGPATATVGQMVGQVFTNQVSVDLTVRDSSFNKLGVAGSVVGVVTDMNLTPSAIAGDTGKIALNDYCEPLVQSQYGISFSNYQAVIFLTPATGSGPAGKTAQRPGKAYVSVFVDGQYWNANYVTSHEYGHALGMDHSGVTYDNASRNLTNNDPVYGDDGCMMGSVGPGNRQYNALHKYEAGWIPSSNVLAVTTSGTYTVFCSEIGTNQAQILRMGSDAYVSYRAPLPGTLDTNLMSNYRNATMFYNWDGTRVTRLHASLTTGLVFTDASTTSLVQQVSCDGTSAVVQVTFLSRAFPVAYSQGVTNAEDTPLPITLSGWSDADGTNLSYLVATSPAHGALVQNGGAKWTYMPGTNYNGTDSFTFQVGDTLGFLSGTATVSITIIPVPDPPVAGNLSVTVEQNIPKNITLAGSDPDGDPIAYFISRSPSNGVVSGTGPVVTYTPGAGYSGSDSFTYRVVDSTSRTSGVATVTLAIAGAMVLHLPFDGMVSNKALDTSGNGFDGTFKNMAATNFAPGQVGNALVFDGVNDTVEVADRPLLRLADQQTLCAWIHPDNTNNFRQIIGKGVYSYNMAIRFGKIAYILSDGTTTLSWDSASSISTGIWTHVACTYDGTNARIYLNGLQNKLAACTLMPTPSTSVVQIGAGGGGSSCFDGIMDDVRIYQRALSSNEVNAISQVPPRSYYAWAYQNLAQLGGDTNWDSDPGSLGLGNLGRYAFGGGATNGPAVARITTVPTNGGFRFRFGYNSAAQDLSFYVEETPDLAGSNSWDCILSNFNSNGWSGDAIWGETAGTSGVHIIEVAPPANLSTTGFFRVRVSQ